MAYCSRTSKLGPNEKFTGRVMQQLKEYGHISKQYKIPSSNSPQLLLPCGL